MKRSISMETLALVAGDRLTFFKDDAQVLVAGGSRSRILVRVDCDDCPDIVELGELTYGLLHEDLSEGKDIFHYWSINGQTLRERFRGLAAEFEKREKAKRIQRTRWLNDVKERGNLFLMGQCFRFLGNLVERYRGTFADRDVFAPVVLFMSRAKLRSLYYACTTERVRKELATREYGLVRDPDEEDARDLLMALWKHPKSETKCRREMGEWLRYAEGRIESWQGGQPDLSKGRFAELKSLFGLSDREVDVLVAATLVESGIWPCDDLRKCVVCSKVGKMAALLGHTTAEYLESVGAKSKLRKFGCLDDEGDLNSELLPFLNGMDATPLASRYYKRGEEQALPWEFFSSQAGRRGDFLKRLMGGRDPGGRMHVLLYGEPGTGKTSFALALAAELGLTPYWVTHEDEHHRVNGRDFRFAAIQVCAGQVDPARSVIVIDEADDLLTGSGGGWLGALFGASACYGDKGRLNDVMDSVLAPCVWITNARPESLDASVRRRFDYSIRFDKLTCEQRERIWCNAARRHGVVDVLGDQAIKGLSCRYEVSAGGISLSVQNLSAMLKSGRAAAEQAGEVLEGLLAPHCQLLSIDGGVGKALAGTDYSLEGLAINVKGGPSLDQVVGAVRRFRSEQSGGGRGGRDRPRMNLLLSGAPGTGKTEFVKYLGSAVDARVVTRMGSDLLDPYVGGTEQRIKAAFRQAAEERAILFLDEIDGLVQSRERATRNWEVTQVNELLHQMENFDGVLIGATNFSANLDAATLRRFTFKLAFDCLTEEGKRIFFRRLFGPLGVGELSPDECGRLRRIPGLTPGDFRTVRQGQYYLGGEVTATQLLDGLERESAAKRGGAERTAVGF